MRIKWIARTMRVGVLVSLLVLVSSPAAAFIITDGTTTFLNGPFVDLNPFFYVDAATGNVTIASGGMFIPFAGVAVTFSSPEGPDPTQLARFGFGGPTFIGPVGGNALRIDFSVPIAGLYFDLIGLVGTNFGFTEDTTFTLLDSAGNIITATDIKGLVGGDASEWIVLSTIGFSAIVLDPDAAFMSLGMSGWGAVHFGSQAILGVLCSPAVDCTAPLGAPVPEPSSVVLLVIASGGLACAMRRARRMV